MTNVSLGDIVDTPNVVSSVALEAEHIPEPPKVPEDVDQYTREMDAKIQKTLVALKFDT